MPNGKTKFLIAKIKDRALSSFKIYNEKGAVSSVNKDQLFALKTLSKNNDLIIQKSHEGNSIALINKSDCLDKMYKILTDSKQFVKSPVLDDKHLNFIIGTTKKLSDLIKELKASLFFSITISEIDYKRLTPRDSSFGILYGLCQTHKKVVDKCPLFGPTLSALKTPFYNLAKVLVLLIETIAKPNITVTNSFEFSK